jgi:virginiamycin B lyase
MRGRAATGVWLAIGVLACLGFAVPGAGQAVAGVEPTEIEVPGGSAGPMTAGPEGALWFAGAKGLGRVDANGRATELPLAGQTGFAQGIAAGPEGNLWITTTREVDRVTTGGVLARFPLPHPNEEAGPIAAGPDGNLWFTLWVTKRSRNGETRYGKAYVVQIDPDGRMTPFPIPGRARQRTEAPTAIVGGPGGDVWFTDPAFSRVDRITPAGKVTEYPVRLDPRALAPARGNMLWIAGSGGVGTIDAAGEVRELRTGVFQGLEIGSNGAATVGPEGDLWFIGSATRILRLTPSDQLTLIRGPGAPAAHEIAAGPEGAIWVSTTSDPIKGELEAPLLRYEAEVPGIEVQSKTAVVRGGKITVRLACGGSARGCAGMLEIGEGRQQEVASGPYAMAAESSGAVTLPLRASTRRLIARDGYLRVPVFAWLKGGGNGFAELVLRAAHPPVARPGRPVVMPLPEGIEVAGIARGPGGDLWLGGGLGGFVRVTPTGSVSTVEVPGLQAVPYMLVSGVRHDLWFLEESDVSEGATKSVIGHLDPTGDLSEVRLPPGPIPQELSTGANGTVWVSRSDYRRPGEIDRVGPGGAVKRYSVGVEAGAVLADPRGGAWFAESGPRIGHIAPGGGIRTFAVPLGGFVQGLTLGPGGDVWFTHGPRRSRPSAIGRITQSGRITEYTARGNFFGSIATGPEGNLWYTTEFPRRIGRMTPRGKVKTWRRGAAAAGSIAVGPEGNLWFAAGDQNTIAIFHP